MLNLVSLPEIPAAAWKRPLGKGWEKPYSVRYASNLDDGPWHGMPLGDLGAVASDVPPKVTLTSGIWTAVNTVLIALRPVNLAFLNKQKTEAPKPTLWRRKAPRMERYRAGRGIQPKREAILPLYPRSWYEYEDVFQTQLICEQFSLGLGA
jgi:non-lysosomal glucosylceramidase